MNLSFLAALLCYPAMRVTWAIAWEAADICGRVKVGDADYGSGGATLVTVDSVPMVLTGEQTPEVNATPCQHTSFAGLYLVPAPQAAPHD